MQMLRRRTMMGKSGGGILPSGYTQLSYIENTSGAVFQLPLMTDPSVVEIVFAPDVSSAPSTAGNYSCIFGSNNNLQLAYQNTGKAYVGNGSASDNVFFADGVKAKVEACFTRTLNNAYYKVDDVDTGRKRAYNVSDAPYVFSGLKNFYYAYGKMYSLKMWNGDNVLVHDLIPCIDPNNVYGMYDIVGGMFYSSINSFAAFTGA